MQIVCKVICVGKIRTALGSVLQNFLDEKDMGGRLYRTDLCSSN